jgi:hypothetical protein
MSYEYYMNKLKLTKEKNQPLTQRQYQEPTNKNGFTNEDLYYYRPQVLPDTFNCSPIHKSKNTPKSVRLLGSITPINSSPKKPIVNLNSKLTFKEGSNFNSNLTSMRSNLSNIENDPFILNQDNYATQKLTNRNTNNYCISNPYEENKFNFLSNLPNQMSYTSRYINKQPSFGSIDLCKHMNVISPTNKNPMTSSVFSFDKMLQKSQSVNDFNSPKSTSSQIKEGESPIRSNEHSPLNKSQKSYTSKLSHANIYLEKRHQQEVERLHQLRHEKALRENAEMRDRPQISEFSKLLVRNRCNSNLNVFERLSDKNEIKRKQDEIKYLNKATYGDKLKFTPKINSRSKSYHRDLKDLFEWNKQKEQNLESERSKVLNSNNPNPSIYPKSEEILKEFNPGYLEMKVEDRLLQKGQK